MKLNRDSRDELRKSVETLLYACPKNKKIQLPKETLDMLLFDTYTCNKEKGIKIKLPVWSGEFLQKLDLSQVDFEDVSWCLMEMAANFDSEDYLKYFSQDFFDKNFTRKIINFSFSPVKINFSPLQFDFFVDYSNTNVKIDFSKSFEAKYHILLIRGCDFSNVDLSNNDLSSLRSIKFSKCDFRNTNIVISNNNYFSASFCDFRGNDLSQLEINGTEEVLGIGNISKCMFQDTGIKINFDFERYKKEIGRGYVKKNKYFYNFLYCIQEYWVGCYLNGKKIMSKDDKQQSAKELKEKYLEFKTDEITKILDEINQQIDVSGPKR